MKKFNFELAPYLVILLMILFSSCGGDEGTTPLAETPVAQEQAFEKLEGSWGLGTSGGIIVDGKDVSLNYVNFSLSFTDGGYSTNNAGQLLKASGTWSWANETAASEIMLDDGKEVVIQSLLENSFTFTFFNSAGGGANGVGGSYSITVSK